MKVVVENQVEVEADITVEDVERYIHKTGHAVHLLPLQGPHQSEVHTPHVLARAVGLLATIEGRQPGDVLLDIAKERGEFRGVLDGVERLTKVVVKEDM